jgi:hypothetical protein
MNKKLSRAHFFEKEKITYESPIATFLLTAVTEWGEGLLCS